MVNNKYITPKGKTKLLKLGFISNDKNTFKYLALGGNSSSGAYNQDESYFKEINGDNYERVTLISEENTNDSQSITLSGIFEDTNYNPIDGGAIKEIGIVDSFQPSTDETFFAIAEVPEIIKTDNISLKYSIIISIL